MTPPKIKLEITGVIITCRRCFWYLAPKKGNMCVFDWSNFYLEVWILICVVIGFKVDENSGECLNFSLQEASRDFHVWYVYDNEGKLASQSVISKICPNTPNGAGMEKLRGMAMKVMILPSCLAAHQDVVTFPTPRWSYRVSKISDLLIMFGARSIPPVEECRAVQEKSNLCKLGKVSWLRRD